MTQFTINVEDKSMLPHLKKILGALNGVSIAEPARKKMTGMEEAMEDIKAGRVRHFDTVRPNVGSRPAATAVEFK